MPAASLISVTPSTNFGATLSNKNTPSVSWQAGDLVLCWGFMGDNSGTLTLPTVAGLTFTQLLATSTAGRVKMYLWAATAAANGSGVIAGTSGGGGGANVEGGYVVKVYRDHGGLGTISAVGSGTSGAPNVAYTLTSVDSVIDGGWGDWNAVAGARTYRTTNLGAATEDQYYTSGTFATIATWHNADATASGSQTIGLTAPSATAWLCAGIEILPGGPPPGVATGTGIGGVGAIGGGSIAKRGVSAGAALTASINDTLTVADVATSTVGKAIADTAAVADALTKDVASILADALSVADARSLEPGKALADSINVADSTTPQAGKAAQVDDTAGVADAQTLETGYGRTIPDTLTVADALTSSVSKAIADAIAVTDATTSSVATAIADTLGVADQATAQAGKAAQVDDSINVADNVATAGGKGAAIDDTLTVADATTANVAKAIADALAVADATSMAAAITVADSLGVADNITAGLAYAFDLADTAGVADALGTATGKAALIADTLGVADALTVAMTKALADTVTVADAAALAVATIIADALAVSDARSIALAKAISDALAVADAATPAPGRGASLADTLTVADLVDLEHVLSAYRPRRPGHWTGALAGAARRLVGHRLGSPGAATSNPGYSDDDPGDVELLP